MRSDARTREDEFYTYELAYPENMGGAVFYVGKGSKMRIDEHEKQARRGESDPRHIVIRAIWASGEQVIKRKVRENITEDEALKHEKFLIKQYGPENLANWTVWQKDNIHDEHTPLQASLYLKGVLQSQIKACMDLDGIPYSRIAFCEYVKDICFPALHKYVNQKLAL
jgi:hypothetical protein